MLNDVFCDSEPLFLNQWHQNWTFPEVMNSAMSPSMFLLIWTQKYRLFSLFCLSDRECRIYHVFWPSVSHIAVPLRSLFTKLDATKSERKRFFSIFTSKCASRYSGVQFFNISTSKSGPRMLRFVHFHLKMCFSPQRRAIFQHLNFKKCSEPDMFCTFSLENVLLATAACNFSTSQLQKVVRECSVLCIFTWECASRHSGVQFF